MTAETEPLYIICWRSNLTGDTGQSIGEFPHEKALSICREWNEQDKELHLNHWISLVRHETQEPTP